MALIEEWKPEPEEPATVGKLTTCEGTWRVEYTKDDLPLLVLRSFGSADRKDKGTVAQVFHLDRASALELNRIIAEALPAL